MAPGDYYLFPKLKSNLRVWKFNGDEEVEEVILQTDKKYFSEGINMLIFRYNKCIAIKGNYIQK
ncbi:hypothetical protein WN55_08761 [Dufourea novaeangliae]|uniref:Uncharacterized protein n=1 Tax=Dufourea novaeangliae TaxID=178035 RepID=A0A154P1D6_DUFNO|nr:hypothetical protein WN55_08761 [Dufourea novaeangliae]